MSHKKWSNRKKTIILRIQGHQRGQQLTTLIVTRPLLINADYKGHKHSPDSSSDFQKIWSDEILSLLTVTASSVTEISFQRYVSYLCLVVEADEGRGEFVSSHRNRWSHSAEITITKSVQNIKYKLPVHVRGAKLIQS